MNCLSAFSIFFLCMGILLGFIAASLTSWILFHTKTDLSLLLQWSGLYQTCSFEKGCQFDLISRPLEGKLIFIMIVISILTLVSSLSMFLIAQYRSKKRLFLISGCFSVCGALSIASMTTLYSFNAKWEPEDSRFKGVPSFGSSYFVAWGSACSSLIAGILSICLRWCHAPDIHPLPPHVQHVPYSTQRRHRQSFKGNSFS